MDGITTILHLTIAGLSAWCSSWMEFAREVSKCVGIRADWPQVSEGIAEDRLVLACPADDARMSTGTGNEGHHISSICSICVLALLFEREVAWGRIASHTATRSSVI